ncbi:YitT family protein [uncultured Slackia sp.]|uniref:YczE/YyaS/YitT family protein n=1 Tax=uncultured Slackia sp. TaxID=665903 RepID=UPI0025D6E758|nr:DUF6198 family protein [uncultured Slackia sp.]
MEERLKRLKAAKTRMLVERWAWFVIGVFINSFGIALITKAALGTSPISSLPYVLSLEFPLTLGMFTFIINMLFIVIQPLLLKDEFKPFQWLQILVNVAFSAFIDVGMALLSWFVPTSIIEQGIALLLGCAVLGFGVSIEVAPNVLLVPGEGAVRAISLFTHKRFGSCKVAFDSTLAGIALVLSLIFFGYLHGIGLGTLVSAVCVGNVVNFCNRRVPLTGHIVNLRIKCERIDSVLKRVAVQRGTKGEAASQSA